MATYYVRADGSATKVNAIGPTTNAAACMSLGTFNAATYAAGDVVYFSAQGGEFTATAFITPSSGVSGNPITYTAAPGESPVIRRAAQAMTVNGKSHVVIDGFTLVNTDPGNATVQMYGTTDSVTFRNLAITGTVTGIAAFGVSSNTLIEDVTVTDVPTWSVSFYITPHSGVVIRRLVSNVGGVQLRNVTTALLEDVTVLGAAMKSSIFDTDTNGVTVRRWVGGNGTAACFSLLGCRDVVFEDCTFTSRGIQSSGAVANHGIMIRRCVVSNAPIDGMYFSAADYDVTIEDCRITNCFGDGIVTTNGCHDFTIRRCWIEGNGNKATTSDGDGVTCHSTDYNINVSYCVIIGNTSSGIAMVQTSSGTVTNCVISGNGGNWLAAGTGVDQVRGGFYVNTTAVNPTSGSGWTAKNNIIAGNYPVEVALTTASASITDSDYNCIWERAGSAAVAKLDGSTIIPWATYAAREPHGVHADPQFCNAAAGNYRLRPTSPALNAGVDLALTADYIGAPVPKLGGVDMGAYELQSKAVNLGAAGVSLGCRAVGYKGVSR
jgi:hypothetical protein